MLYLGGEVSVKYPLAVQVLQSSGDIQRQTNPDAPRQVQITVQQLLQVTSIYILEREQREDMDHYLLFAQTQTLGSQLFCRLQSLFKGFTLTESDETVHSKQSPLVVRADMFICEAVVTMVILHYHQQSKKLHLWFISFFKTLNCFDRWYLSYFLHLLSQMYKCMYETRWERKGKSQWEQERETQSEYRRWFYLSESVELTFMHTHPKKPEERWRNTIQTYLTQIIVVIISLLQPFNILKSSSTISSAH